MKSYGVITMSVLAAVALGGCSGFGKSKSTPVPEIDPNSYPQDYRRQIALYLMENLKDRADFRRALIAEPALKPVGQSTRYVVCLQFNGNNDRKDKVIIYLGGSLQQYVDAKPEQCGDAQFQPFPELAAKAPS
jgi:hypothetical protein